MPERGGACAASDAERVYELNEDGVYDILCSRKFVTLMISM